MTPANSHAVNFHSFRLSRNGSILYLEKAPSQSYNYQKETAKQSFLCCHQQVVIWNALYWFNSYSTSIQVFFSISRKYCRYTDWTTNNQHKLLITLELILHKDFSGLYAKKVDSWLTTWIENISVYKKKCNWIQCKKFEKFRAGNFIIVNINCSETSIVVNDNQTSVRLKLSHRCFKKYWSNLYTFQSTMFKLDQC